MSDSGADDSKPSTASSSTSSSSARTSLSSPPTQPPDAASCQIQVFARIRPSKRFSPSNLQFDPYNSSITLTLPTAAATPAAPLHADQFTRDYVNNQRLVYPFFFHGLFPPSTTQDTVFDTIGKQCVASLLDGYNSTIFAYGQTGSGKTYTITGGVDSYEDRGIIPRTLSCLFEQLEARQARGDSVQHTVRVSYLEIYNEAGYDLLDRPADMSDLASIAASSLASLPRVSLLEDEARCVHLQNLGEYAVGNVQDALELLFRGDTNRIVCETPSNDASSRSHCLFTVTLEARDSASGKLRRSKLHLVDLAGSERIKKTQVTGRLFKEAAFINLSLHHLEQVILALHHRSTGRASVHVPYRNSFLTSTLRDSLGGNCRTYMIATLSGEPAHIDESVSTARFAGRVGSIRNEVWREEAEDMEGAVKRLKGQVRELKEEVRRLRGEEGVGRGEALSEEDRERCREVVRRYVWCAAEEEAEMSEQVSVAHQEKVRYYLKLMKDMLRSGGKGEGGSGAGAAGEALKMEAEVKRLSGVVQEREDEIARLKAALLQAQQAVQPQQQLPDASHTRPSARPSSSSSSAPPSSSANVRPASDVSLDSFRAQYAAHEQLEQRKDELNALIRSAKALGEAINASKAHILRLKQRLTAHSLNRTLAAQDNAPPEQLAQLEEAERGVVAEMEEEKRRYRERFGQLKAKKEEVVHLQGMIERGRRKMEAEFERWKASRREAGEEGDEGDDGGDGEAQREQPPDQEGVHARRAAGEEEERRRQQQAAPVSRPADKRRVYEEVKEQVSPTPQPHSHAPPPVDPRFSTRREPLPPAHTQPPNHTSVPTSSPLRAGALSSLMLGQPPAAAAAATASSAGGGSAVSGGGGRAVARTGNVTADAEIDKFWALRDKLKSHAATVQSAVTTTFR